MKNPIDPVFSPRIRLWRSWVAGVSSCGLMLSLMLVLGTNQTLAGTNNPTVLKDLILTAQDNGKKVNALVGQRIFVQLEGNPSTGFEWSVIPYGDSVASTGNAVFTPDSPGLPGGGGMYSFPYQAMKPGGTRLDFTYSQPWNPQEPGATFRVTIRVAEEIEGPYLILTAENDGRTLDASVGTRIAVQLEGGVADGYEWVLISTNGDSVVPIGNGVFTPDPKPTNMVGGSGFYSFPLQAMKEGTTVLEFGYCPYQNHQNPRTTFRVTIRVVDALILTAEDEGKTVDISVGRRIQVQLEDQVDAGLVWLLVTTNGGSVVSTGDAVFTPYSTNIGSPGILSFPMQAIKQGETVLGFVYRHAWLPQETLSTFGVTIRVVGPRLSIARVGLKIEIKWPMASSYGYELEGTGRMSPPHWAAPNVLVQPDGANYKVVLDASGESLYFRLSH